MSKTFIYRILRFLFVVGTIILGIIALFWISKYTYPFIIGIFVSFLINPLVNFLEHKGKMPRSFAVLIIILLLLTVIVGIITILVVELVNGFTYLASIVPSHFRTLVEYIEIWTTSTLIPLYNKWSIAIQSLDPSQQNAIMENIKDLGTNIAETGSQILKNILEWIPQQLSKIPNIATVIIFSLLATFFISKDWYRLGRKVRSLTPEKVALSSSTVYEGLKKALVGFIRAQLTLISITAVIVLIGLLILRVDYAVTISIIIGLVDLLPYLGTGLVFVPWIIYMFFAGNYFLTIGLSILYAVVIVQRQVMEPKVLSSNIGLDPLATLVSLFVGYQLLGLLGLIAGPVFIVILNTLHKSGVIREIWSFIKGPAH